jgi:hypothetical protein
MRPTSRWVHFFKKPLGWICFCFTAFESEPFAWNFALFPRKKYFLLKKNWNSMFDYFTGPWPLQLQGPPVSISLMSTATHSYGPSYKIRLLLFGPHGFCLFLKYAYGLQKTRKGLHASEQQPDWFCIGRIQMVLLGHWKFSRRVPKN